MAEMLRRAESLVDPVLIYRAQCARVGKRRGRKNGLSYDRTWLARESAAASLPRG